MEANNSPTIFRIWRLACRYSMKCYYMDVRMLFPHKSRSLALSTREDSCWILNLLHDASIQSRESLCAEGFESLSSEVLVELGWNQKHSNEGWLSVTTPEGSQKDERNWRLLVHG